MGGLSGYRFVEATESILGQEDAARLGLFVDFRLVGQGLRVTFLRSRTDGESM